MKISILTFDLNRKRYRVSIRYIYGNRFSSQFYSTVSGGVTSHVIACFTQTAVVYI